MQESILAQTVQPDNWLVITQTPPEDYVFLGNQRHWYWKQDSDLHPICANYLEGIDRVWGDKIFFIEDDEVYLSPTYLEEMSERLDTFDLVGLKTSFYYNLPERSYDVVQRHHASLCCTAMTRAVIPTFRQVASLGNPFIDMILWTHWRETMKGSAWTRYNLIDVLSLKDGTGVGDGHRPEGYIPDVDHKWLRSKLGRKYYKIMHDLDLKQFYDYWLQKTGHPGNAATLAAAGYLGWLVKEELPDVIGNGVFAALEEYRKETDKKPPSGVEPPDKPYKT